MTVPSSFVEFVNVDYGTYEASYSEYCPTLDASSGLSPLASADSLPRTPGLDTFDPDLDSRTVDGSMLPHAMPDYSMPSKTNGFEDISLFDEDDDGLPPFDEWYQDIARRGQ